MTYGVHRQIHIQQRPVQMIRRRVFDCDDLVNSGLPEPGKLLEGKMQFFIPEQQPEPVLGDMRNFSWGIAFTKRSGCYFHVSERTKVSSGWKSSLYKKMID